MVGLLGESDLACHYRLKGSGIFDVFLLSCLLSEHFALCLSWLLVIFKLYYCRTLLARLDHCATRFGRRLLRSWLARPLLQVKSIQQRQTAIKDLKVSVGLFYFVQG
jgi:hypothetical protein